MTSNKIAIFTVKRQIATAEMGLQRNQPPIDGYEIWTMHVNSMITILLQWIYIYFSHSHLAIDFL